MRLRLIEGLLLIALALIGAADGFLSLNRTLLQREVLSPGAYLIAVSAVLLVLSCAYLLGSMKRASSVPEAIGARAGTGMVTWGAAAAYAIGIPLLGYALASFLFFGMVFYLLGTRPWQRAILASLVFTLVFYLVFIEIAGIRMPSGWIGQVLQ